MKKEKKVVYNTLKTNEEEKHFVVISYNNNTVCKPNKKLGTNTGNFPHLFEDTLNSHLDEYSDNAEKKVVDKGQLIGSSFTMNSNSTVFPWNAGSPFVFCAQNNSTIKLTTSGGSVILSANPTGTYTIVGRKTLQTT